ncbi:MAG: hypothetical protein IJD88_02125 [Clostridia bacterium]|nr:hypothetical protein [Clostridia bacterium]
MFDNISQGLFLTGGTGYLIVVPILRFIATIFMVVSTYKILKIRNDKHKICWLFFIIVSPIFTRIVYEIYRRWIAKKVDPSISDIKSPKSSKILLTISIILIVVAAILSIVSAISMGLGFIKSYADNEPLAAAYDVHGNEYFDYMEVPLYDKEGNIYTYEPAWFVVGDYIDQNGKAYDGDNCYLDQEGFFYYDKNKTLKPHETHDGYYTDGENIYYGLWGYVYWDDDGVVYDKSGKYSIELFDFEE